MDYWCNVVVTIVVVKLKVGAMIIIVVTTKVVGRWSNDSGSGNSGEGME